MIGTRRRAGSFRLAWLTLVAAAIGFAACSKDGASPSQPVVPDTINMRGTYVLATVDAKNLPVTILSDTNYSLDITAATLALQAGGRFVVATTTRETVATHPSMYLDSVRGTWTLSGSKVTLTDQLDGSVTTATWDGSHMTYVQMFDVATNTYAYIKQH